MKLFTKSTIGKFVFYFLAINIVDFIVDVILMDKTLSIWTDELLSHRILIILGVSLTLVFFTKKKPEKVSGEET